MSKPGYRERCIKDFDWDPIVPYPGAEVVGDPRENTVAALVRHGFTALSEDTFTDGHYIAKVGPYYALPSPIVREGRIVSTEIRQLLVTYKRVQ
jgi:hypothetical protein